MPLESARGFSGVSPHSATSRSASQSASSLSSGFETVSDTDFDSFSSGSAFDGGSNPRFTTSAQYATPQPPRQPSGESSRWRARHARDLRDSVTHSLVPHSARRHSLTPQERSAPLVFPTPRRSSEMNVAAFAQWNAGGVLPDMHLAHRLPHQLPYQLPEHLRSNAARGETPLGPRTSLQSISQRRHSSMSISLERRSPPPHHRRGDGQLSRTQSLRSISSMSELGSAVYSTTAGSKVVHPLPGVFAEADPGSNSDDFFGSATSLSVQPSQRGGAVSVTMPAAPGSSVSAPGCLGPRHTRSSPSLRSVSSGGAPPLPSYPAVAAEPPVAPLTTAVSQDELPQDSCFGYWYRSPLTTSDGLETAASRETGGATPSPPATSILSFRSHAPRSPRGEPKALAASFGAPRFRQAARDVVDDEESMQRIADFVARMEGSRGTRPQDGSNNSSLSTPASRTPEVANLAAPADRSRPNIMSLSKSSNDSMGPSSREGTPGQARSQHSIPSLPQQPHVAGTGRRVRRCPTPVDLSGQLVMLPPAQCTSPDTPVPTAPSAQQRRASFTGHDSFTNSFGNANPTMAPHPPRDVAASVEAVLAAMDGCAPTSASSSIRRNRNAAVNFCLTP